MIRAGLRRGRGLVAAGVGLFLLVLMADTAHGQTLLSQTTWGGASIDVARGVALAADGSSYVVGVSYSFATNEFGTPRAAISLVKFAADGSLAWQRLWTGPTLEAGGVALSSDGAAVYVTGTTADNGNDALLLKFTSAGDPVWQRAWGGSGSDAGNAVATGPDGSVHVTGTSHTSDGAANLVVLKFDANGAPQWQRVWEGVSGFEAISVTQDGSVVAAGSRIRPDGSFEFDAGVVKMDSAGNLLWERLYSAGGTVDARGGMAISPDGSIVIAGAIQAPQSGITGIASLLIKLDADGNLLFDRQWGGKNGNSAAGVAVAPDGSIYLAGAISGLGDDGNEKAFVVRVAANGKAGEAATWGGTVFDSGAGVGVNPDGTVALAATTESGPPYSLQEASRKVATARGSVADIDGIFGIAAGATTTPIADVIEPDGSTTYGGDFEQALIRLRLIP